MADAKITDLTIGTTVDPADWLIYVQVADTSMSPSGTDKRVAPSVLMTSLLPSQSGNSGKVLSTNGAGVLSWIAPAVGGGISSLTGDVVASGSGSVADRLIGYTNPIAVPISANTNDWAPTGLGTANRIRITASSTGTANALMPDLTGIAYPSVTSGQLLVLENVGGFPLRIVANSGLSAAGNQFLLPRGNFYLLPGDAVAVLWSASLNGWVPLTRDTDADAIYFGGGGDGNATISGSVVLTRDMYYQNLTLASGAALNSNGFRLYVSEVLDLSAAPAGSIFRVQQSGASSVSGTGGAAGPGGNLNSLPAASPGTVGANGATAGGSNATNTGLVGAAILANAATSGGGGSGSAAGITTGATPTAVTDYKIQTFERDLIKGIALILAGVGGAGGGGGSGDNTNSGGGGGGGGGGGAPIWLSARVIHRGTNATASLIQSQGGNGGNGRTPTTGNCGGGGGGAGAAGGWIILYSGCLTGTPIANAVDASGGNGGNGGSGVGSGTAGGGGGGGNGGRITLYNVVTNAIAEANGSAGSAASGASGGAGNSFRVTL